MQFSQLLRAAALTAALGGTTAAAHATTFTVTKIADTNDGACTAADCSLREAIGAANATGDSTTIEFASPLFDKARTIALENGTLRSVGNVIINGPEKGMLTIDAGHKSRVFDLKGGSPQINHLVMANGVGAVESIVDLTEGGCVYIENAQAAISRCAIVGGSAMEGGGIFVQGGSLHLTNSTIYGNTAVTPKSMPAQANGGGVCANHGVTTIRNCTVANNRAYSEDPTRGGFGGGIASGGDASDLVVGNSLMAYNTVAGKASNDFNAPDVGGPITSEGFNLIRDTGNQGGFGDYDITGADPDFELDPAHGNIPWLKDNGGATLTIAIGLNGWAHNWGRSALTVDQRNFPRPNGSGTDIGAYELNQPPAITSLTLSPQAPTTQDAITATAVSKDPDGGYPANTFTYSWKRTRDGKTYSLPETSNVLNPSLNLPGDVITVTAIAHDPTYASAPQSASVTIINSPISISSFVVQPKKPYTYDKMVATVQTSDLDKSRPFYTWTWTKNDVVVRTANTRSNQDIYDLNVGDHGDKGDVIAVTVGISDGGIPATTTSATFSTTILNSIPTMSALSLSPQAPAPGTVLELTYSGRDADNEPLNKIIVWKINGKVLPTEKTSRLDLAKYPGVKVGDVISADMRLSDGTALSKTLSASVTVTAPPVDPPTPPVTASASGHAA